MSKRTITNVVAIAEAVQELWVNLSKASPVMPESLRIEITEQYARALFESGDHADVSAIGFAEIEPDEDDDDDE